MPRIFRLVVGLALSLGLGGCATPTPMTYQQWKSKLERLARAERIRQENAQVRRDNRVVITAEEQRRASANPTAP